MSGRSLSPLTLAVALLVAAAGPAAAQDGVPKMPPPTPPGPVIPVTGTRIEVSRLGPVELSFDFAFPLGKGPFDQRQLFTFTEGVFGDARGERAPRPAPAVLMSTHLNHLWWDDATDSPPNFQTLGCYTLGGPARSGSARAPMSRDMSCGIGSYCAPPLPKLHPPHLTVDGPGTIRLVAAPGDALMTPLTCPPCPLPKLASNPLLGTWYRELPALGAVVAFTFTHDELKLTATQSADGRTATVTATAHYAVTADGLVFGAVTGGDVDVKSDPKAPPAGMEFAELSLVLQTMVDTPFSCRTKATSGGLMVSGVKFGRPMGRDESEQMQLAFGGLFTRAKDGTVPAPTPAKSPRADAEFGAAIGGFAGAAVGGLIGRDADRAVPPMLPPDCQRYGIDFSTNPPQTVLPQPQPCPVQPVESFGPPFLSKIPYLNRLYQNVGPQPAEPVGCGVPADGTKQLAADAFNRLLQQSGAAPSEPHPLKLCGQAPPVQLLRSSACGDSAKQLADDAFTALLQQSGVTRPAPAMGGMTLPPRQGLEHYPQYFAPHPAFPLPRELACQEAAVRPVAGAVAAKGVAVGTWVREAGGKLCVVKVEPGHLTLTVSSAEEFDGKTTTASMTITADYHLARDGATAVGLITGVDVSVDGDFSPEDARPFFEMVGEMQKALEDKPFALTFRPYGDALVIGNVRMPPVSGAMEVQPAAYTAGRYKSAGEKLPKPKVARLPDQPRAPRLSDPLAVPDQPGPAVRGPKLGAPGPLLPPTAVPIEAGPSLAPPPLPPAPNVDLLPPQQIPPAARPRVVPSGGSWEPTAPAPTMPRPTPPGEVVPVSARPDRCNSDTTFAADPNIRMQQLLYSNGEENVRQLGNEWRRFWFNDQPSHLTPERVHGGIE